MFKGPRWGAPLSAVQEPNLPAGHIPRHYVCQRAKLQFELDGRLDKPFWEQAPKSESFVQIEGKPNSTPRQDTWVKMLWDDDYLYLGAYLEEDQIWATLTERDSIICDDNNFEIFIDPDGDSHNYYELEINALNTIWDLFLPKPYRDGGPRVNAWDIQGLKTAVHVYGELNNPTTENRGWSLEVALPWEVLRECAINGEPPEIGHIWRINFSRVKWPLKVEDGQYVKDPRQQESNWAWSNMGVLNMHYPELWGYLLFADGPTDFVLHPDEQVKWELRRLYYRQRNHFAQHGSFSTDFSVLKRGDFWTIEPLIEATTSLFQARVVRAGYSINIREDGRVWVEHIA